MPNIGLYYTGGTDFNNTKQKDSFRSLGGFISNTQFLKGLSNLFGPIKRYIKLGEEEEYRVLALKNNTENTIASLKVFLEHEDEEPVDGYYATYQIAIGDTTNTKYKISDGKDESDSITRHKTLILPNRFEYDGDSDFGSYTNETDNFLEVVNITSSGYKSLFIKRILNINKINTLKDPEYYRSILDEETELIKKENFKIIFVY